MAQKDTRVNIDLAKDTSIITRASKEDSAVMRTIAIETKKDSSSMKTIAVLGMLFLPSSLIAVSHLFLETLRPLKLIHFCRPSSQHQYSAGAITVFLSPMPGSNTTGLFLFLSLLWFFLHGLWRHCCRGRNGSLNSGSDLLRWKWMICSIFLPRVQRGLIL